MRERLPAVLAYIGAGLTLAVAVCVPFILAGTFSHVVASIGLHIDATYTGGTVARTISHAGYQVVIYKPVRPHRLQSLDPFVQIAFTPASALPAAVSEDVDLEGDGQPNVHIAFSMPSDLRQHPSGFIIALSRRYRSFTAPGPSSFSQMLVRTGDTILIRVPIRPER